MSQSGTRRKQESIIDENLKRVYEEAMDEGVPDKFRQLLDELKKQEKQGKDE